VAERTRTRLDPAERRRQILKVAIETFREEPYSEVSLDDLATQAGVTRGLLHHYFGSKRALYLAVLEQTTTIPDGVELIPPGVTGDLRAVAGPCVERWLRVMEVSGGLWSGLGHPGNIAEADVDAILTRSRDSLVQRMIDELPFPDDLDAELLRSALRAYGAMARVTSDEWLVHKTLTRAQTGALLEASLIAIVEEVVPAMVTARANDAHVAAASVGLDLADADAPDPPSTSKPSSPSSSSPKPSSPRSPTTKPATAKASTTKPATTKPATARASTKKTPDRPTARATATGTTRPATPRSTAAAPRSSAARRPTRQRG